jgi:hypothetical protein
MMALRVPEMNRRVWPDGSATVTFALVCSEGPLDPSLEAKARPPAERRRNMNELATELATYNAQLPNMLREHEGQFVLIHGDTVVGFWPTHEEAYYAGCERFGAPPFLVMPVVQHIRPAFIPHVRIECPRSTDR